MRRRSLRRIAAAIAATICVSSLGLAQDVRLIGNLEVAMNTQTLVNGAHIKAMGFTTSGTWWDVTEVVLSMKWLASPVDSILDVSLYSNGIDNNPETKLLSFESRIATEETADFVRVHLKPNAMPFKTFRLQPNTTYWLVVRSHGTPFVAWESASGVSAPDGIATHFGIRRNNNDGLLPKDDNLFHNKYEIRATSYSVSGWYFQNPANGQIALAGFKNSHFTSWRTFPQVVGSAWEVLQFGQFGGSSHADAFLRNKSTGQLAFWFANGQNFFQFVNIPQTPPSVWQFKGVGRFGAVLDFPVYQNPQSGVVVAGVHNGSQITQWRIFPKVPNAAWEIVTVGDFNSDGISDILFRNKSTGQLAVWRTDGFDFTTWHVFPQVPSSTWDIIGLVNHAAYDNPGVIFHNKASKELALWRLNGAGTAFTSWMPLNPQPESQWQFKGFSLIENW